VWARPATAGGLPGAGATAYLDAGFRLPNRVRSRMKTRAGLVRLATTEPALYQLIDRGGTVDVDQPMRRSDLRAIDRPGDRPCQKSPEPAGST
jgi:hypothetical protein